MSEINYFIPPTIFFDLILPEISRRDVKVIFRRFKSATQEAGFFVPECNQDLGKCYVEGGFQTVYFSLGKTPSKHNDWNFTEVAADELLELRGGRLKEPYLELSRLRSFTKVTRAKALYDTLVRKIRSVSSRGKLRLDGHPYPGVYYSDDALRFLLCYDLENTESHLYKLSE
jgi:hypothetical protein